MDIASLITTSRYCFFFVHSFSGCLSRYCSQHANITQISSYRYFSPTELLWRLAGLYTNDNHATGWFFFKKTIIDSGKHEFFLSNTIHFSSRNSPPVPVQEPAEMSVKNSKTNLTKHETSLQMRKMRAVALICFSVRFRGPCAP